jgi:von Willebrand factor type A domain
VLVADRSGSMGEESGIPGMTRMDVLKESAHILIDTLRAGDALGVVGFATDAKIASGMTNIIDDTITSAEREALKAAVDALTPGGSTSIGDGVALANTTVAPTAPGRRAIMVLTDGHENAAAHITDVMDEVTADVYAVGMGTAGVLQPDKLNTLTSETGGYLVLTGKMDETERYNVAKYFLQILAAASGDTVISDPQGTIRPGEVAQVPFQIARTDHSFDAVVMIEKHESIAVELRAPDGTRIAVDSLPDGVGYQAGDRVRRFRVSLPVQIARTKHHAGAWRVVLSMTGDRDRFVEDWRARGGSGRALGIPYAAIVTGRSDKHMDCRVSQTGFEPGAVVSLSARVTDRRQPMQWEMRVFVDVHSPDGAVRTIEMNRSHVGTFESTFAAAQLGVYTCRFRAKGRTRVGDAFTREHSLTAQVWHPTPTDDDRVRKRESKRRDRESDRRND